MVSIILNKLRTGSQMVGSDTETLALLEATAQTGIRAPVLHHVLHSESACPHSTVLPESLR